jgi:hypothetical protein
MSAENKKEEAKGKKDESPKAYEVTSQGSLGLLALGAVGIKAWRKKRDEEKKNSETQPLK